MKILNYSLSLDEIVFEHRNKEYGACDLRSRFIEESLTKIYDHWNSFCLAAITPL